MIIRWVLVLQGGALLLFVCFVKMAVPQRVASIRAIGEWEGAHQMQKELIKQGVVLGDDIPRELRLYPEKGMYVSADLDFQIYYLTLFLPAVLAQLAAFVLTVLIVFQGRKPSPEE